jgi:hypothetical protein
MNMPYAQYFLIYPMTIILLPVLATLFVHNQAVLDSTNCRGLCSSGLLHSISL